MDKQNEQQLTEFQSLLEELRKQLLDACIHFDIWEQLWPTQQAVDVLNQYIGFFLPTRNAHLSQFFIKVCNVLSNDRKAPSFYHVFSMLNNNMCLAPNIDVQLLRSRLKKHKEALKGIEQYRNTRAAHWDTEISEPQKPVLFGNSKQMLEDLQAIFNEIYRAHTGNQVWSFKTMQYNHTSQLLETLEEVRHHKATGKQA